jgi:hypothetical protein
MRLRSSAGRSTKEHCFVSGGGCVTVPCDDMVNAATFVGMDGKWKRLAENKSDACRRQ